MPFDRFMIVPYETGLQTDLRPWLIPDDAFASLRNAYVFRGRVRKRFGSRLMGMGWSSPVTEPLFSRLRIQVGTIGAPASPVPGNQFNIGQAFSAGDQIFTVFQAGAPAAMLATGPGTGTFNTVNGAFALAGTGLAGGTPIWWYPSLPVMGLTVYEVGSINNQPTYAFDPEFAYVFAGGFWQRAGAAVWHGGDSDFFWSANWSGLSANLTTYKRVLFTTNFQVTNKNGAVVATDDPIRYWDGTTWTDYTPRFAPGGGAPTAGPYVKTCRIIVTFHNRLLLLNTIEVNSAGTTNTNFQFRCRFSKTDSPFSANAFYEPNQQDNAGAIDSLAAGGGYIDATTQEAIVSAEFIKDRLIVYFEKSTWEIVYLGNQVDPFGWQKINTELGSEATFSSVPFDKQILTMGNTGVHACNGANVERIDTKIPDQVFQIANKNEGVLRVAGIRDYFTEMVYWTFPSTEEGQVEKFPNAVLVYNYRNGSWALNDDCLTCFGYFEQQNGTTWTSTTETWEEANFTWNSGTIQSNFRQVIAGNQQGFVVIIDAEESRNARAMQITQMTYNAGTLVLTLKVIDHTITSGDFIAIENAQGVTIGGFSIYKATVVDKDTVTIANITVFAGTYTGGGTVSRVSNLGILSKQWNPYDKKGRDVYIAKIDFAVQKTSAGQITVNYATSSTEIDMLQDSGPFPFGTGALLGTSVLETSPYLSVPIEAAQKRLWHTVYFQAEGECVQIFMSFTDDQIVIPAIAYADFEMEGMILHTTPTTARLQ